MPLLKSKKVDPEKQDVETMVKGTISVDLKKIHLDQLTRRGETEAMSNELKIMLFYELVNAAYVKEKTAIDDAWAIEQGGRKKKKMPLAQLRKITKAFEKKYGE